MIDYPTCCAGIVVDTDGIYIHVLDMVSESVGSHMFHTGHLPIFMAIWLMPYAPMKTWGYWDAVSADTLEAIGSIIPVDYVFGNVAQGKDSLARRVAHSAVMYENRSAYMLRKDTFRLTGVENV